MSIIDIARADSPLVLGLPHTGTDVPADIRDHLNDNGRALSDTDWHIHELYSDLGVEVTTVRTLVHRYSIDVNRDPEGVSLYPGQNTTTLCPLTDFDGNSIYKEGREPDDQEMNRRLDLYHRPYHEALREEIERVREIHGFAILYDCHSIRGEIPFLFDGLLPDFNIGTNEGTTCAPEIETAVRAICECAQGYRTTLNGRFKGGWTTRHYGRPDEGMHAIQMELAQRTYMREAPPWDWRAREADALRVHLSEILKTLTEWRSK